MNRRIKKKKLNKWIKDHVEIIEFSTERVDQNTVPCIAIIKLKEQEHD